MPLAWVKANIGGADATRIVEKGAETPVWVAADPSFSKTGMVLGIKRGAMVDLQLIFSNR